MPNLTHPLLQPQLTYFGSTMHIWSESNLVNFWIPNIPQIRWVELLNCRYRWHLGNVVMYPKCTHFYTLYSSWNVQPSVLIVFRTTIDNASGAKKSWLRSQLTIRNAIMVWQKEKKKQANLVIILSQSCLATVLFFR